jgi:hypothetical protein
MTIDEAIDNLKSAKEQGVKNIVLAWWAADMFGRKDDENWEHDSGLIEEKMDWSSTHDQITEMLEEIG